MLQKELASSMAESKCIRITLLYIQFRQSLIFFSLTMVKILSAKLLEIFLLVLRRITLFKVKKTYECLWVRNKHTHTHTQPHQEICEPMLSSKTPALM